MICEDCVPDTDREPIIEENLDIIPFQKNGFALQVFVKCNLIRHKLTVCATKKRHLQLEMV